MYEIIKLSIHYIQQRISGLRIVKYIWTIFVCRKSALAENPDTIYIKYNPLFLLLILLLIIDNFLNKNKKKELYNLTNLTHFNSAYK